MELLRSVKSLWARPHLDTEDPQSSLPTSVPTSPDLSLQERIRLADTLDRRRQKERSEVRDLMERADLTGGSVYFDTRWLDAWNEFLAGAPPPGRIDFSRIVDEEGDLLPGLQLERDYRIIPHAIWTYLSSVYGSNSPPDAHSIVSIVPPANTPPLPRDDPAPTETVRKGPVGLANPRLYCYLNASVQFLMSAERFRDFCREKKFEGVLNGRSKSWCEAMAEAADGLFAGGSAVVKPAKLWNLAQRRFAPGKMNDAVEFIHFALETIDWELADRRSSEIRSELINDCFAGTLRSEVHCLTCESASSLTEHFIELSVPLCKSVKSALKLFTARERLDAEYDCQQCAQRTDINKRMTPATCPYYLLLSVKRFRQSPAPEKASTFTKFHKKLQLPCVAGRQEYKLYSVIEHRGTTLEAGHYISFCRRGHLWYLFDDRRVTQVSLKEVLAAQAFVLMYRKV